MTPAQINAARKTLGLSYSKFAAALGYCGSTNSNKANGFRLCTGKRPLMPEREATLRALLYAHERKDTQ